MITVAVRFLAGRYHATPWGRNVNEGEVEWPVSPFRLARGIIDVWRRRFPGLEDTQITRILAALAAAPSFFLPPAARSHLVAYLNMNKLDDPNHKEKVYDAFVAVNRSAPLYVFFPGDLNREDRGVLDTLLRHMSYLGRSESWIEAELVPQLPAVTPNCRPAAAGADADGDSVTVACLKAEEKYRTLDQLPDRPRWFKAERGRNQCSWLESICLSSDDLLTASWSDHPAIEWVSYNLPAETFAGRVVPVQRRCRETRLVQYAVCSNVLPRIEETVAVAERIRVYLMGIHKKICGGDPRRVSPIFSGKDDRGRPLAGHNHAYYLPIDADRDGRIDHVIVQSRRPFSASELQALDALRAIWQPQGREHLHFVLNSRGDVFRPLTGKVWVSATPFVTVRHYKKKCGGYKEWLRDEIIRECQYNGLPTPAVVKLLPRTVLPRRQIHWWAFLRSRKKGCPLPGYGFVLQFSEPVAGPFALGALSHFGLGLFLTPDSTKTIGGD